MKLVLARRLYAAGVVELCATVSLAILSLAVSGPMAQAQTVSPQPRVVSAPQSDKMVALRGNVHPMARPANDRGILQDQQPVTRMHRRCSN